MEANVCDVNHLDDDVLLPPRKRLLAGLKKQNSNDQSRSSTSASPPTPTDTDMHFKKLLSSHSSATCSSSSLEEIVESSKKAALAATKVAEAARAAANEKAAIAAKAVAAAKSALDLVAAFSEDKSQRERRSKRNKSKRQVPLQSLYNKYDELEDGRTDEEIARKLHRVINSSPRILKHSPSSDSKSPKHKRLKISPGMEKIKVPNGGMMDEDSHYAMCNGNATSDTDGSTHEVANIRVEPRTPKSYKFIRFQMENEKGHSNSKEIDSESTDDTSPIGRNRGRIKLKNFQLSICSSKEQGNSSELKLSSSLPTEDSKSTVSYGGTSSSNHEPCSSTKMSVDTSSTWKCQDFKAPECIKQNKAVQS